MPKIIIGVGALVLALLLVFHTFVVVQAGNLQVLTQLGRTTGKILYPGQNVKTPFDQNTVNYSTRQATYETSDFPAESRADYRDLSVDTTSSDGQQMQLKHTMRFSIDRGQAEWVLNNIVTMDDLVEKAVKTEARSHVRNIPKKDTAFQLNSEQVFGVQEELENTLRSRYEANGIILDELLLRKTDLTEEYFSMLEEKQTAEEKIMAERNILEQEIIREEQAIIIAEAEAEKIKTRGESLRLYPEIIEIESVQKLSPNINWGMLPEGVIPFIDLENIQQDAGSQPLPMNPVPETAEPQEQEEE